MSLILGKLNSILLREHFGVNAQIVGDCLLSAVQTRPLSAIVKATGLTKNEVSNALASLIRFRLVKFTCGTSGNTVEYSIKPDKVYLLARYSKYVQYVREKCGDLPGLLINELQRVGSDIATNLIIRCTETEGGHNKLSELRTEFMNLVQMNYVMRAPAFVRSNEATPIPEFSIDEHSFFLEPEIDLPMLIRVRNREGVEPSDKDIYWFVNIDRLHQEFRDLVILKWRNF